MYKEQTAKTFKTWKDAVLKRYEPEILPSNISQNRINTMKIRIQGKIVPQASNEWNQRSQ